MERRSFGVSRLNYLNRIHSYKRIKGLKRIGRIRRLRLEDIILLGLPLLLLLIFLPSPEPVSLKEERGQVEVAEGSAIQIRVYNPAESVIDDFALEDYLVGVVAAEMPSSFHAEALKAQAVAARTFAASRMQGLYGSIQDHFGAHVCTDSTHCQAWISKERFLQVYGKEKDWQKIEQAVKDTENKVMTYGGALINPLYHSNSGGVTEAIEEVWTVLGSVPYLKSVYSPDESQYAEFEKKVQFKWDEIKKIVKAKHPEAKLGSDPSKEIEIMSYSNSGRINEIRVGSIKMSGIAFRELLALRSTNLDVSFPDKQTVQIISRGYGHGVGMSQCGADAMGKKGLDYIKILEYYYTGINVEEIAP